MLFRKPSVQTEGLLYPLVRALVVDRSGVMSGPGAIFKRCSCRDAAGRPLNNKCPRLAKRGHRAWSFHASATNLRDGRSGCAAPATSGWPPPERLAATGADRTARSWTVERWLRYWLSTRTTARGSSPPVAGPARPDPTAFDLRQYGVRSAAHGCSVCASVIHLRSYLSKDELPAGPGRQADAGTEG